MASTEIAIRHSTKSAARLPVAFKTRRNSSAAALAARAAHGRGFRPQNCGAVSRCSVRPGRMLTVARLPRFYNKFRLQSDRSTSNAERAAGRKLARLLRRIAAHSPYLPQSQPRTAAADPVLPPPGDLVRTMAPDQTDPNAACAPSSQLLLQSVATTI